MFLSLIFFIITISNEGFSYPQDAFASQRQSMVEEQLKRRGISDARVLLAMKKVPRHEFVPAEYIDEAYEDRPVPIGYGQTISQPYIVALMTQLLSPERTDKILEIGTGSGYQAAILAEIIDSVFTIEIVKPLAQSASGRLKKLGYRNVQVLWADGYYGWQEHAPFDGIIVTAAAEHIPPPLIQQLRDGGKMVIPVGHPLLTQNLIIVEKKSGRITTRTIAPVRFVPLTRMN
jgi:protein-L-isoaspartate(D-aspartate) O-methyltransferase